MKFRKQFYDRGCKMTKDCLRSCFLQSLDNKKKKCYPVEIGITKDTVNSPSISMMFVLNNALTVKRTMSQIYSLKKKLLELSKNRKNLRFLDCIHQVRKSVMTNIQQRCKDMRTCCRILCELLILMYCFDSHMLCRVKNYTAEKNY